MIEAGALISRRFHYDGVEAIVENGVSRDILKSGLATIIQAVDPKLELFRLDAEQASLIVQLVGREALEARGIL